MSVDSMRDHDFLVALDADMRRRQQVKSWTEKYPGPSVSDISHGSPGVGWLIAGILFISLFILFVFLGAS